MSRKEKTTNITNSQCRFALKMQSSIQNRIFPVFSSFYFSAFRSTGENWKKNYSADNGGISSFLFLRHSSRHVLVSVCSVTVWLYQNGCNYLWSFGFWRFEFVVEKNVNNSSLQTLRLRSLESDVSHFDLLFSIQNRTYFIEQRRLEMS